MEDLLIQLQKALENNLYYLALYVTLTLPDICGALSSSDGRANKSRYIKWYERFARDKCASMLDGDSCYLLRCSSLHQGHTQSDESTYSRVIFIEPYTTHNYFHNNILNGAIQLDLVKFCHGMIDAVNGWKDVINDNPNFQKNYELFMKRYPEGLSPYIVGISVIS
jgi:hypothetical protein